MIPSFENMEALKHDMEVNPHCYTEGYTVFLEDIKETITYRNGEWVAQEIGETTSTSGEVSMSLYEMNRQLINQLPDYNEEAWGGAKEILKEYLEKHNHSYYMFLYSRPLAACAVIKVTFDALLVSFSSWSWSVASDTTERKLVKPMSEMPCSIASSICDLA